MLDHEFSLSRRLRFGVAYSSSIVDLALGVTMQKISDHASLGTEYGVLQPGYSCGLDPIH